DLTVGTDSHQNIAAFLFFRRLGTGAIDRHPAFFHEGGGDDKKDQHDKHDVEHRGDVDIVAIGVAVGMTSCHRIQSVGKESASRRTARSDKRLKRVRKYNPVNATTSPAMVGMVACEIPLAMARA